MKMSIKVVKSIKYKMYTIWLVYSSAQFGVLFTATEYPDTGTLHPIINTLTETVLDHCNFSVQYFSVVEFCCYMYRVPGYWEIASDHQLIDRDNPQPLQLQRSVFVRRRFFFSCWVFLCICHLLTFLFKLNFSKTILM